MNRELGTGDAQEARGLSGAWAVKASIPQANWDSFAQARALVDDGMYLKVPQFRVLKECFDIISPVAGHSILEVGAGSAYYKRVLDESGFDVEYTGMDCSQAAKDFAASKFPDVPYVLGDATAIPAPDGSFDTVISGYILIHIYDWELSIREAARVSRRWVILHRVITQAGPPLRRIRGTVYGEDCLVTFFTVADVMAGIRAAGLVLRAMLPVTGSGENVEYTFLCEKA